MRSAALAALLAALAPAAADGAGFRLDRLGAPKGLTLHGQTAAGGVGFVLPSDAVQGRPLWYLLHVHARVSFVQGDGEYILSAASDGYTGAQIVFRVGRGRVMTDTLGLVDGRRIVTRPGRTAVVDFRNYAQLRGVRAGRNTLRFELETLFGPGVSTLQILPDSGVETTRILPDELGFQVPRDPVVVPVGGTARLPFRLVRRGGRPDGLALVRLGLPADGLAPAGARTARFARVGSGRYGGFAVRGVRAGSYLVQLFVPRRYNQPSAGIAVVVVEPGRRHLNVPLAAGLGVGLVAAAGLAVAARRPRP